MEMEMAEMEIRMAMEMGEALDHAKGGQRITQHINKASLAESSAPDPVPHKESGLFHIKTHTTATNPSIILIISAPTDSHPAPSLAPSLQVVSFVGQIH